MSNVIEEFLVSLGFAVDEASARRSEEQVKRVEDTARKADKGRTKTAAEESMSRAKAALKAAGIENATIAQIAAKRKELDTAETEATRRREQREQEHHKADQARMKARADTMAWASVKAHALVRLAETATRAMVNRVAEAASGLEQMAYTSERTSSSAKNIRSYAYAVSQLGGSFQGALSSLEAFSQEMRENPKGFESFLKSAGVQTRNAKGELLDFTELVKRFRASVGSKPYELQLDYMKEAGIDEATWRAMDPAKHAAFEEQQREKFRKAGFDPDAAKEDAKAFAQIWRSMWESISILGEKILSKITANVGDNFKRFTDFIDQHGDKLADVVSKIAQVVLAIMQAFAQLASSDAAKGFLDGVLNTFGKVDGATGKWIADIEKIQLALGLVAAFIATTFTDKIRKSIKDITDDLKPFIEMFGPLLKLIGVPLAIGLVTIGSRQTADEYANSLATDPSARAFDDARRGASSGGRTPLSMIYDRENDRRSLYEKLAPKWAGGKDAPLKPDGGADAPQGDGTGTSGKAKTGQMMSWAMDQLRREGVPEDKLRQSAAHLVGQAFTESKLNPNALHDPVNGQYSGYGIYGARDPHGWGDYKGARRSQMVKWLEANGYARNSAEGQMRYMAKEAMSGGYPITKKILMGRSFGNLTDDTNAITKEFESPAVVNHRSPAVANAYRTGPEEPQSSNVPEQAGTFPNGAPRVLKPSSMPNAPGETIGQADERRKGAAAAQNFNDRYNNGVAPNVDLNQFRKGQGPLETTLPEQEVVADPKAGRGPQSMRVPPAVGQAIERAAKARDALAHVGGLLNESFGKIDASGLRKFQSQTAGFDFSRATMVPPPGGETTNNSSVSKSYSPTFNTNVNMTGGNAKEQSDVWERHERRSRVDDLRYAASIIG